eukprot:7730171-Pyramimonas_sp.AAC.1
MPELPLCGELSWPDGSALSEPPTSQFRTVAPSLGNVLPGAWSNSPWQNGRVERHGGWVKDRVKQELDAGSSLPGSLDELDEL